MTHVAVFTANLGLDQRIQSTTEENELNACHAMEYQSTRLSEDISFTTSSFSGEDRIGDSSMKTMFSKTCSTSALIKGDAILGTMHSAE